MTVRIDAGWDVGKIGLLAIKATESVGPTVVVATVTAGTFAHTDISAVTATSTYTDFATQLKTELDAVSAQTYTVTYGVTAGPGGGPGYTISIGSGTTTLEFTGFGGTSGTTVAGALMAEIIGFDGNQSTSASHTSDERPIFALLAATGCESRVIDDYEPDGVAEGDHSIGGRTFSLSDSTAIKFRDFVLMFESHAATYKRSATATFPWTYEHMWEHVRSEQPFLLDADNEDTVYKLRPENANVKFDRAHADHDDQSHIPFFCYMLGRL